MPAVPYVEREDAYVQRDMSYVVWGGEPVGVAMIYGLSVVALVVMV